MAMAPPSASISHYHQSLISDAVHGIAEKLLPQTAHPLKIKKNRSIFGLDYSDQPRRERVVCACSNKIQLETGFAGSGFFPDDQDIFERLNQTDVQFLLVTGPTGSGKTTTLLLCLHYINSQTANLTVEEPIDIKNGINHCQ